MHKRGRGAIYSCSSLREEHAEGSRTQYLAGPETHCGNWQKFWLVKNKVGLILEVSLCGLTGLTPLGPPAPCGRG
jgi:hypothetical protein